MTPFGKIQKIFRGRLFTQDHGYSLVELAIFLGIVGILTGVSLPILSQSLEHAKNKVTQDHQERVLMALAHYAYVHGRLPCPGGNRKGVARLTCSSPQECKGYIPYRTLGLPKSLAEDGYKKVMHYGVEPTLTQKRSQGSLATFCKESNSSLQVKTLQGGAVIDPKGNPALLMAVVLISEGTPRGGASLTQAERANLASNLFFYANTTPKNNCRHIVRWITREDLMAHYAGVPCASILHKAQAPFTHKKRLPLSSQASEASVNNTAPH